MGNYIRQEIMEYGPRVREILHSDDNEMDLHLLTWININPSTNKELETLIMCRMKFTYPLHNPSLIHGEIKVIQCQLNGAMV